MALLDFRRVTAFCDLREVDKTARLSQKLLVHLPEVGISPEFLLDPDNIFGYTEKTFTTEAQSAWRKKKARLEEEFLCELLLFSPCPPCLRGEITFFQ